MAKNDTKKEIKMKINQNQSKKVKVALLQTTVSSDIKANLKKTIDKIKEAAKSGAKIICMQELFRTIYIGESQKKEYFAYAESLQGETITTMTKLAKELQIVLIVPIYEKAKDGNLYNSAIVVDADGKIVGHYRKMHIPNDPGFWEQFYFKPGDFGFKAVQTKYAKIGVLICYDQWFPEAARLMTLDGAEILFYPTAIGWYKEKEPAVYDEYIEGWVTIQRAHAIANSVYVASVNRVGKEFADKVTFWGNSFIAGPFGKFLARAGEKEETIMAECDLSQTYETRDAWRFFYERRTDAYEGLMQKKIKDF